MIKKVLLMNSILNKVSFLSRLLLEMVLDKHFEGKICELKWSSYKPKRSKCLFVCKSEQ